MNEIRTLCDAVRQNAYAVHRYFRRGYPEKVYENSLANRLRKLGLIVEQQKLLSVYDEDGSCVGHYFADLLVSGRLIVELKAVDVLTSDHEAQVLSYLKSARLEHALLINFGARSFQIRKYAQFDARDDIAPDT